MRLEAEYTVLIYTLIGLSIVLFTYKTNIPIKLYKILLALVVATILPALIPGHGEMVIIIPNASLFLVDSTEAKVIGVIFTMINFVIAWFILFKVCRISKGNNSERFKS